MAKKISLLIALFTFIFFFPQSVEAKRVIPRSVSKTTATKTSVASGSVSLKVKFRSDRRAIVATFSNLSAANSVSYNLTYDTKGTTQGAGGSLTTANGDSTTRELLFGSCSHGICRYDSSITNAKLVVLISKSGKKISKTFRLKV